MHGLTEQATPAQLMQDPLTPWMVPLFAAALALNLWQSYRNGTQTYQRDDTRTSLVMLVFATLVDLAPKLLAVYLMLQIEQISPLADVVGRQWWAWIALFFLDDFCYYWFHRSNHGCRLLWAGHVNHHSSQYLNLATALRQGVGERIPKYLYWLPLPLLGFDTAMVLTMISLNLFYQFWIHWPKVPKLPNWIELIFNTPSHHRVHHGSNPLYLDRNHGGVLIIWDRLFGTYQDELEEEPVQFGLTHNLPDRGVWRALSHEYRAIYRDVSQPTSVSNRLQYLFGPPGWRHKGAMEGADESASALRARLRP